MKKIRNQNQYLLGFKLKIPTKMNKKNLVLKKALLKVFC